VVFLDLNFTSLIFDCVKFSSILNFTNLNFDEFCKKILKFPLHHTQILALIIFVLHATSINSISRKIEFSTVHTNTLIIQAKY
jgi:hypothetical protein